MLPPAIAAVAASCFACSFDRPGAAGRRPTTRATKLILVLKAEAPLHWIKGEC